MKSAKNFLEKLIGEDGYFNYTAGGKTGNLLSNQFGILASSLIKLDSQKYKQEQFIEYILSFRKNNGVFYSSDLIKSLSNSHDEEYFTHQLTDFSLLALNSLDYRICEEFSFLKEYKDIGFLENWLLNLEWTNPWLISNNIMFILNFLIYEKENAAIDNDKYINFILDWLDDNQDSENGYWNLGKGANLLNQMAGAYHFYFFYTYLNRQINYVETIIDSTLKLQDYDGLFSYQGGGGSCEDLDAIDILCRMNGLTDYREEDIRKAMNRAYLAMLKNQNEDGGFCWAKRNKFDLRKILNILNVGIILKLPNRDKLSYIKGKLFNQYSVLFNSKNLSWKYSGIESMNIKYSDSDLFSTWFRLLAMAIIEETFPEVMLSKEKSFDWNLLPMCGLGYYK